MQCFVLQNPPFLSSHIAIIISHSWQKSMSYFSDGFCSLFLGTVFYLFSRGYLEFKLPLSACLLCTVPFICWVTTVPSSSLAFVEHFPFSPLRMCVLASPVPANSQHSNEVVWSRLKWAETLPASVSVFVAALMIAFERKKKTLSDYVFAQNLSDCVEYSSRCYVL